MAENIICPKCNRDLTNAVRLLGPDVMELHMAIHDKEESLELRRLVEQEVLKNCEIGLDALNIIGLDGSTYDRNHELLMLFDDLDAGKFTMAQFVEGLSNRELMAALRAQYAQMTIEQWRKRA